MKFTDDDLKRLKELLPYKNHVMNISHETLSTLLARLEAAEKAVYHLTQVFEDDMGSVEYTYGIGDEADQALEAWCDSKRE